MDGKQVATGLLRIALGLTFLWAFFDKLVGLGFITCREAETNAISVMCERAWLAGGSPTTGFLTFATQGPFAQLYQSMAGSVVVDWLFMLGLLSIGIGLTFGILMRLSIVSGVAMMLMMYTAALPPEHHPFIDDHIVYALALLLFWFMPADEWLGYGKTWKKRVRKYPYLR